MAHVEPAWQSIAQPPIEHAMAQSAPAGQVHDLPSTQSSISGPPPELDVLALVDPVLAPVELLVLVELAVLVVVLVALELLVLLLALAPPAPVLAVLAPPPTPVAPVPAPPAPPPPVPGFEEAQLAKPVVRASMTKEGTVNPERR